MLPEHEVTLETANGLLSFSNKDWLIGKQLFIHRHYEVDFIKKVLDFLEENDLLHGETVCDVGANIGMISIYLLKSEVFFEAIAFEPFPRSFEFLIKNVEQNGLRDRIQCFQCALSSDDGICQLELADENSGDNRVRSLSPPGEMREEARKVISVESCKFDSFMKSRAINPDSLGLIWLDIQGHEGHFFLGAEKFFNERKIPVVSEFWSYGIRRSGISVEDYCEIARRHFSGFWLFEQDCFIFYPITALRNLFDKFPDRRQVAQIILL